VLLPCCGCGGYDVDTSVGVAAVGRISVVVAVVVAGVVVFIGVVECGVIVVVTMRVCSRADRGISTDGGVRCVCCCAHMLW